MSSRLRICLSMCLSICALLGAPLFATAALAQPAAAPAAGAAAPATATSPFAQARFMQVAGGGGVPLNVVDQGDPAKPAVLFIHGFRQSTLSWSLQFGSDLAKRCRLVAFDLRGHGNSGSPWQPEAYHSSRPWADDVARVIQALGLDKPLIVGWSFGGNVAMDFAALYPDVPVAGYLLTGTAGGTAASPPPPAAPVNAPPRPSVSPDLALNIGAVEASIQLLFPNPALDKALLAQFAAAAMRVGPWVEQGVARRPRSGKPAVAQPVTFATGGKDPLVGPATVARLKDFFPQARLIDFPAAGHAVFLDEAVRFNALIDELHCGQAGS
ncbi:alpha/beta fold hydrolase [Aquabacterium sp. OR-4]|uniref:alpha/beta fold hydrolase n=1 Tax=Aquabacterium sp. OR-4 TaxID=2978127 RepID=UPI0028C8E9BA|nr:alpha/beta hydrolase [Aquabacterium sp. OR-4]MDT7836957.1 alpha/beta hydrolase [Aquabacterium sp. OR-4]